MVKKTYVKVDRNIFHLKICNERIASYICAWYIQNISSLELISSQFFSEENTTTYFQSNARIDICPDPKGIKIEIITRFKLTRFDISIASRSGKVPLKHSYESINQSSSGTYRAFIEGEDFQKLKQHPNNTSVIICRMKLRVLGATVPEPTPAMNSEYIKSLKAKLKQYSGTSKEIVNLRVGDETVCANKAILCIRSPVFATMFENDMKETKSNTVAIVDIKMPVLRALVSYLYSGLVPGGDFDFSCHLYYAADKYDITDLRLACIALLVSKASLGNLFQLLKLSLLHNDELLKSSIMVLININIKVVMLLRDWEKLMHEDPELALEAATLFD